MVTSGHRPPSSSCRVEWRPAAPQASHTPHSPMTTDRPRKLSSNCDVITESSQVIYLSALPWHTEPPLLSPHPTLQLLPPSLPLNDSTLYTSSNSNMGGARPGNMVRSAAPFSSLWLRSQFPGRPDPTSNSVAIDLPDETV